MKRIGLASSGVGWTAGIALAVAFALVWATVAQAQSFEVQYGDPEAPAGGLAGTSCMYVQSEDGQLNAGDIVEYRGDYSISSGASVVIDDSDDTQGTFIDGRNAEISEGSGADGIKIAVTGDPINVSGGDGVLTNKVCNSIVASTGIVGDAPGGGAEGLLAGLFGDPPGQGSGGSSGSLGLSVLPDTGGVAVLLYLGMLSVAGGGLVLLRHRSLRGSR
ncbi:MAG: LPXTG cell wall anchor domain-containing protein [Rubrobacter sp.]|nr:LPXTG cell wall anchor domain-containing protein [Rubrobacter sp.]